MAVLAYRVRLGMYGLLYSGRGIIFGAGYSDVNASLPVLRILMFLCLLTALLFLAGAVRGSLKPGVYGLIWIGIFGLLGGLVYPELIQRFIVTPNEIEKEAPYIARAIEFTRKAYALDRFEQREFSAVEDLKPDDIRANQATIRNVRLWDHKPLLTTFAQLQEIRTYYDFERVDNDRYWIDGIYRQVSLSPRELSSSQPPQPHLDQRAPDVHARLRPLPGPRQRGHARRPAGSVYPRYPAGIHDVHPHPTAGNLLW